MNYLHFFIVQIFFLVSLTETSLSFQPRHFSQGREILFPIREIVPSVEIPSTNWGVNSCLLHSFQKISADRPTLSESLIPSFTESTLNYIEIQKKTTQLNILKPDMQKTLPILTDEDKTLHFTGTILSLLLCNKPTSFETSCLEKSLFYH